jgi:hypothetical protein
VLGNGLGWSRDEHGRTRAEEPRREALELANDAVDHALDPVGIDRALAQRDLDGADQLVTLERNAPARALDDHQLAQLDPLEGREPAAAVRADPAAANRRMVVGGAGILDLRVSESAKWATHGLSFRSHYIRGLFLASPEP